jgi:hypothetical protein
MRLLSTVTVALCLASCDAVGRLIDRDVSFWDLSPAERTAYLQSSIHVAGEVSREVNARGEPALSVELAAINGGDRDLDGLNNCILVLYLHPVGGAEAGPAVWDNEDCGWHRILIPNPWRAGTLLPSPWNRSTIGLHTLRTAAGPGEYEVRASIRLIGDDRVASTTPVPVGRFTLE